MTRCILFTLVFILSACGDPRSGEMPNDKKPTKDQSTKKYSLDGHPLAKYNQAEDVMILRLFGNLTKHCGDRGSKIDCDAAITSALWTAKDLGMSASEDDFRNPLFLEQLRSVYKAAGDKNRELTNKTLSYKIGSPERNTAQENETLFLLEKQRRLKEFEESHGKKSSQFNY